jgi:hypothetical protein
MIVADPMARWLDGSLERFQSTMVLEPLSGTPNPFRNERRRPLVYMFDHDADATFCGTDLLVNSPDVSSSDRRAIWQPLCL